MEISLRYHALPRKPSLPALFLLALCAAAQDLTITQATVVDAVTGKTQADTSVVIHDNRIVRVGEPPIANTRGIVGVVADGRYLSKEDIRKWQRKLKRRAACCE